MGTTWLNLLSSSVFILTVVTATIDSYRDHGDCSCASSTDRLTVNTTEPKVYEIELTLTYPSASNEFFGTCNILVQVHQRTKTISIHAYHIRTNLSEIELKPINATVSVAPKDYRYCNISQILDLYFEEDIIPARYYLKFLFFGRMGRNQFKGLSSYSYKEWGIYSQR